MSHSNKSFTSKLLTTAIFFGCMQLLLWGLHKLSTKPIFDMLSLEHLLTVDGSFNDLYYQQETVKQNSDKKNSGRLIIINSGSFDKDSFRLQLAKTIGQLQKFKPKVIGIDHTFKNQKRIGTDSLIKIIESSKNIILSTNEIEKSPLNFKVDKAIYGNTTFEEEQISIRRYSSSKNTFAYKIASKLKNNNIIPFNHKSFFINYITNSNEVFKISSSIDTLLYKFNKHNKLIVVEGIDILNNKDYLTNFLQKVGSNNAFLIGHFGSNKINNVLNDSEDRRRVPCDKNLVERKESMFGVQIHANAIENYLNPEIRFYCWTDSIVYSIIKFILIFLFIYYLLYVNLGKAFNIIVLAILTFPLLYLVLFLMSKNIYLEIGLTLIEILIIEEIIETFESLQHYYTKLSKKWKKEI